MRSMKQSKTRNRFGIKSQDISTAYHLVCLLVRHRRCGNPPIVAIMVRLSLRQGKRESDASWRASLRQSPKPPAFIISKQSHFLSITGACIGFI